MKTLLSILASASFLLLPLAMTAQYGGTNTSCLSNKVQLFSNCAAVFIGDKILVDDYSPSGKCVVSPMMKGKLTISAVNLSAGFVLPYQNVGFKVAIKDAETNTMWLFSEETFYGIDIEKILAKCKGKDKIVLITVDRQYALPHNEITVKLFDGC